MPKVILAENIETGERREVFAIDYIDYDKDVWRELGDNDETLPAKPIMTTMGKPIVPKKA